MSARTAGRRRQVDPTEFDRPEDDDPAADTLFVRLAARVAENPAMSGGLLVMGLTAMAVVSNALFLQRSPHPEPWFATRPAVAMTPEGDAVTVPDPRPRGVPPVEPPTPRIQPDVPPAPQQAAAAPPATSPKLVADLQQALAAHGLYDGKVDGIFGSRTRAAISAYERSAGLPVTGAPSPDVLAHMQAAPPVPPAAPQPPASATVAAAPAESVPAATAAAADSGAGEAAELLTYSGPSAANEPSPAVASSPSDVAVVRSAAPEPTVVTKALATPEPTAAPASVESVGARRTLSVQKALNQIGYGPVPENGIADEATIAAIRRFELDNALPITGAAGDTLIERLVAIGAMEAA